MLDEVPSGWKNATLGDVLTRDTSSISASDLAAKMEVAHYSIPAFDAGKCPSIEVGASIKSNKTILKSNRLLFSKLNPRTPRIWRIGPIKNENAVCSTEFWQFAVDERHSIDFLEYFLGWDNFLNDPAIKPASSTNSHQRVNKNGFDRYSALLPPLAEQQRIAEILTSVDDTIRATEAVIAQTERVKLGVMEDLLTGGLGSDAIATGEVPNGWEVNELKVSGIDVIDGDRGKTYPKAADFSSEGYCLFLSAKNVTKSGFQFETKQFVTEEKHNQLRKGHLHRDDIVLTTRGTLGNIAFYDADTPFPVVRINSGMVLLRNIGAKLETKFLYQLMRSPVLQSQIAAASFGSAQPQLTVKIINALKLPIPPKSEQSRILAAISSVNDDLVANKALLSQTKRLKQGLMSDLLTGKKRVM